jgi:hypothetical protein
MSLEGRFSIDVGFSDSTSQSGVQSLKRIALADTTTYASGKVAIVTGTAGTAQVVVSVAPSTYKNASGEAVSFSSALRFAFSATGSRASCADSNGATVLSSSGRVSVSDAGGSDDAFAISTTAGTCSYTLVIYGA